MALRWVYLGLSISNGVHSISQIDFQRHVTGVFFLFFCTFFLLKCNEQILLLPRSEGSYVQKPGLWVFDLLISISCVSKVCSLNKDISAINYQKQGTLLPYSDRFSFRYTGHSRQVPVQDLGTKIKCLGYWGKIVIANSWLTFWAGDT